ncbi:MAG: thiamine pyrophosphate-binding protein [Gammaproteobacteria bacterium]|nr:thiamine pyrophosphate-binding protein [Gammaproteobacteria bacterium]
MRASTGAQALVAGLERQGAERVFCVPGESYLGVLDALRDSTIETVVARHEGAAAMMAEADAKLTGRPGIVFVTRGPGASNASSGIHIAQQDSTPLILFAGQVERAARGRDAFQELDFEAFYGGMAKSVTEVRDAERVPKVVVHAFRTALADRPGPVVVALPEDMLGDPCARPIGERVELGETAPDAASMQQFDDILNAAKRPLAVVGGSTWNASGVDVLRAFAERAGVPVTCVFRRQQLFDHEHPHYAGDLGIGPNPVLRHAVEETDLLLLLGTRLSEIPSQSYTLPVPGTPVVHVHPDSQEPGRVHPTVLGIHARPSAFLAATNSTRDRSDYIGRLHASYLDWSKLPHPAPGDLTMGRVLHALRELDDPDMIVTNGAGNYSAWVHRFHRFRRFGTQVAPTSGSMGYGLPAAIAAKLRHPNRTVVCFAGDGCFQMTGQEIATAVQYSVNVIILVVDNGMYGTIRMHQERAFPGRVHATSITNPDFAALAKAYGAYGERVERDADFTAAFERARNADVPALLHLIVDPEAITPTATLSAIGGRTPSRMT